MPALTLSTASPLGSAPPHLAGGRAEAQVEVLTCPHPYTAPGLVIGAQASLSAAFSTHGDGKTECFISLIFFFHSVS